METKVKELTDKLYKKYDYVKPLRFEIWKDDYFLSNYPNYRLKWKKFTDLYDDYYYYGNWKGVKNFSTFDEANQYCKRKGFENYTIMVHFGCKIYHSQGSKHWDEGFVHIEEVYNVKDRYKIIS